MAGRRPATVRPSQLVSVPAVADPATARAVDALADAVQTLQTQRTRFQTAFDLTVGVNRVPHGLGRKAVGCTVTPTVADATFAWAFSSSDDRVAIITVIGSDQPACPVEFW